METRIALLSIIVEDKDSVLSINNLLHEYREYIISRMGVPYAKKDINLICVAMDAPSTAISALSGKLGMIHGVATKTLYSKLPKENGE
ncbi:MAG: TM1266 family iron-only hydrogenase system putative regulator [Anaerovoracaceae bacterium]|jgi:putative iron-only hydrogenase system regulator